MARMTTTERAERKAERTRIAERIRASEAEAARVVASGVCPTCGCGLRRNLAMGGWWQCQQYGAEGFRKDSSKPSCSFQCFTA